MRMQMMPAIFLLVDPQCRIQATQRPFSQKKHQRANKPLLKDWSSFIKMLHSRCLHSLATQIAFRVHFQLPQHFKIVNSKSGPFTMVRQRGSLRSGLQGVGRMIHCQHIHACSRVPGLKLKPWRDILLRTHALKSYWILRLRTLITAKMGKRDRSSIERGTDVNVRQSVDDPRKLYQASRLAHSQPIYRGRYAGPSS
jgi:hypothetical protein